MKNLKITIQVKSKLEAYKIVSNLGLEHKEIFSERH